ncbi:MAG: hypothetical protein CMJ48_00165, partial [Planctomycetaceae bacterium]|nr:hypothetical protein [Planctomycetaceae bacterium]
QLAFIEFLRHIVEGVIEPVEAVRAYHAVLEKLGARPNRSLEDDLTYQTSVGSYGGNSTTISIPASFASSSSRLPTTSRPTAESQVAAKPSAEGQPDFARMTSAERLEYHRSRLNRMFGG